MLSPLKDKPHLCILKPSIIVILKTCFFNHNSSGYLYSQKQQLFPKPKFIPMEHPKEFNSYRSSQLKKSYSIVRQKIRIT